MSNAEVVRQMRAAFQQQDVQAAERLLAEEFSFTSPQDDHLDRAAYLRICFPTSGHFSEQILMELLESDEQTVLTRYEYELHDGKRYRNMEATTVVDGRITAVEVYFGGEV